MRGGEGAELWGVGTSTGGALKEAICTSNDTLETVQDLRERLEKDDPDKSAAPSTHCCVFVHGRIAERVLARSGDHCGATFKSSKSVEVRRQNAKYKVFVLVGFSMMVVLAILQTSSKRKMN
ncbi:hypothetical protein V1527DRAFT_451113 [Lipomyces starkeyi]